MRAESEKIRNETSKFVSYLANEEIIYDGNPGMEGYDFIKVKKIQDVCHTFKRGILIIERTKKKGVYQLQLGKYNYQGKDWEFLPKNELVDSKRKLRVTFEARVTQGLNVRLNLDIKTKI
jgi:hypothetical protein